MSLRPPPHGRAAAVLLLAAGGCVFSAPAASLGGGGRDSGTILLDSGAPDDAAVTPTDGGELDRDAGVALPDAPSALDALAPDAVVVIPDAGFPDAAPPRDAAPADAAHVADASCAPFPAPATVALAGSVSAGMELDAPMLLGDLDGDGAEELLASSRRDEALVVIDRLGCGPLTLTATRSVSLDEDAPLLVVRDAGTRVIYGVGSTEVTALEYDGTTQPPSLSFRGVLRGAEDFDHMAVSPDQEGAVVTAIWPPPNRAPGYFAYDPIAETGMIHRVSTAYEGRPAYFSHPAAAVPRFAVRDGTSMWLLRPDSSDRQYTTTQTLVGDPIVVRFSGVPGVQDPAVLVFGGRMRVLDTLTIDRTDISVTRSKVKMMRADLGGEPIAARVPGGGGEVLRVFALLTDGTIHVCELLVEADGAVGCVAPAATETFSIPMNERSDQITLVTAFVDADAAPDLVIAEKDGTVHFRSGANINNEAAPSVRLGRQIGGTPAVIRDFWAPFGQPGLADAIVVPHRDGTISVIGVPRRANGANAASLWPQHRRDASRTAFYP